MRVLEHDNGAAMRNNLLLTNPDLDNEVFQNMRFFRTLLQTVANKGTADVFQVIVDAYVSQNKEAPEPEIKRLLLAAACSGHVGIVKILEPIGVHDPSILYEAAGFGHLELAIYLTEAGTDVDVRDKKKRTPLMPATIIGQLDVVKCLLAAGANLSAKAGFGSPACKLTALDIATAQL